jgi:hypothetical protein
MVLDLLLCVASASLDKLRETCPAARIMVHVSHLGARQRAETSAGADVFFRKGEMPESG